jgi:hypothetical protein
MPDPERKTPNLLDLEHRLATLEAVHFATRHTRREAQLDETKKSLLATLVERQTGASLLGAFNRTVDNLATELAQDLLRDPAFREELRALMRTAFSQALKELHEPAPPNSERLRWP